MDIPVKVECAGCGDTLAVRMHADARTRQAHEDAAHAGDSQDVRITWHTPRW